MNQLSFWDGREMVNLQEHDGQWFISSKKERQPIADMTPLTLQLIAAMQKEQVKVKKLEQTLTSKHLYDADETAVLDYSPDYVPFPYGEGKRVEIQRVIEEPTYLVSVKGSQEAFIVEEKILRKYGSLDDYEDMYCDVCGGTACNC